MKLFLVRRKLITAAACLLAAAGMFYIVNHPAIVGASATTRQLPIYCVQRDQKVLSISFDAAWGDVRIRPLGHKEFSVPMAVLLYRFTDRSLKNIVAHAILVPHG